MNRTDNLSIERRPEWFGFWNRFWFTALDPFALHMMRVLTGLLLLGWILPFAGYQDAFFSLAGWADQTMFEEMSRLPGGRGPVGWSLFYLAGDDAVMAGAIYWFFVAAILLFTFGIAVRITAIITWVGAVSFLASPVVLYDADFLVVLPPFYLMIAYLFYGQSSRPLTPLERLLGPRDVCPMRFLRDKDDMPPSYAANFALRLFQVHFALIVLVSFLHKLQMAEWWSGFALFYPLHPPYETTQASFEALKQSMVVRGGDNIPRLGGSYSFFLSVGQYAILGWQLGFPFFAWRRGLWRWVLVGGGVIGWIGSAFVFRQPLFGPVILLGCLSYLSAEEWRGLRDFIVSVLPWTKAQEAVAKSSPHAPRVSKPTRV